VTTVVGEVFHSRRISEFGVLARSTQKTPNAQSFSAQHRTQKILHSALGLGR
jgi:hypothetical protein